MPSQLPLELNLLSDTFFFLYEILCYALRRHRLVPSSRRVGGEQNMMPSVSVFCKPRCCVDVQTDPVDYVLCPSPSLPSS